MARTGLSKSQVKATREQLLAQGRYPSVDAVRAALGDTGSKSTIHKYLKELDSESGAAGEQRDDTARRLHDMVELLADQLHAQAATQTDELRAGYEAALRHKDLQLKDLRAQVAQLAMRVRELEADAAPRKTVRQRGFGLLADMLGSSRSGRKEHSAFSAMFKSGRSDILKGDELLPSGFKPFLGT
jgi:hypothetical protein